MASLVETYVEELAAELEDGVREWVRYHRIPEEELDERMAAIAQAAHQVRVPDLHLDLVPTDKPVAPVATLPGTVVIRMGSFPPPWAANDE